MGPVHDRMTKRVGGWARGVAMGAIMGVAAGSPATTAQEVALGGVDPTSYFGATGPVEGDAGRTVMVDGATYRFADDRAQARFEADEDRYEPVFGGHDPVRLARGEQAVGNPRVFSVVGERVFLFVDEASRETFLATPGETTARAVKAFAEVAGEDETGRLTSVIGRRTKDYNLGKQGLAVSGYDPVAYFREGGGSPTKGRSNLTVAFDGAEYRFSNSKNRARFLENPTRYEPAHGGWCSYAASQESYAEIDPEKYLIEDDRLLLFYNGLFNDTKKKWEKSKEDLLPKADRFWKSETGEDPRHG